MLLPLVLSSALAAAGPATTLAVPGRANAHASIAADGDLVVVAWSARDATGTDVYAAASTDGGRTFAAPVRVNDAAGGAIASAERPPRVAIATTRGAGGRARVVGVLWLATGVAPAGPRVMLSRSADDGRTFGALPLSGTDTPGIRGWASLSVGPEGVFQAAWLDGRDAASGTPAGGASHAHHHATAGSAPAPPASRGPRQDLYYATAAVDAVTVQRVATDVCFCCKTALATHAGSPVLAWRHIYPNSERDIALAVRNARTSTFAPPVRISADRWQLQGCPDDGPALAASGTGRLHVVWPTLVDAAAATPEKGIFHARTTDGRTFTPRRRLDAANSGAAHPQVAASETGAAIALWDASGEGGRHAILLPLAEPSTPQILGPGTYPVAAATASGFVVAWTSGSGDAAAIRVVRTESR